MSTLSVAGSFTATGTSTEIPITHGDLSISGTFDATVQLQRNFGGAWQVVETITAPVELVIEPGKNQVFRLECTVYTSGTVNYAFG